MSKTDENIKNILQEKFSSHESPVNPEIWNSISNSLAGAPTGVATSMSLAKIIGIAAAALVAVATTLYVYTSSNDEQKTVVANTNATTETIKENKENQPSDKGVNQVNREHSETSATNSTNSTNNNLIESQTDLETIEDLKPNGTWEDNGNSSKEQNQIVGNKSTSNSNGQGNQNSNSANVDEPISASFHVKEVDPASLRYFFFPKTNANVTFKWSSSDGYSSTDMTFSHQFSEEGNYNVELTITDKQGNSTTESSTVRAVRPIIFTIPNAFSPGINGRNDVINFEEATQNEASMSSVKIMDRNGNTIYESKNSFIWDGTANNGEIAPNGVYTYVITATDKLGESRMNKGTIQLFSE